jgi:hypothetical protein
MTADGWIALDYELFSFCELGSSLNPLSSRVYLIILISQFLISK